MSFKGWVTRGLTMAALVMITVAPGAASTLALDSTRSISSSLEGNGTWGWQFTVLSPIVVDGLGVFDRDADGLATEHAVGLWRESSAALLVWTTVTTSSALVASTSAAGAWRVETVSPVTLTPGSYVIGAYYPAAPSGLALDGGVRNATISTMPEIAFGVARGSAGSFGMPGFLFNNYSPGVFGPNFTATRAVPPVPEPTTLTLLALVGLGALASRGRRRPSRD